MFEFKDALLQVQAAGLNLQDRFLASTAVISLKLLKTIATDLKKPIGDLSTDEIINFIKDNSARAKWVISSASTSA